MYGIFCFMTTHVTLLVSFVALFSTSFGQKAYDSLYVRDYSSRLAIYSNVVASNNDLVFANRQQTTVSYKPNNTVKFGLGFNYRWLGLGGTIGLKFLNDEENLGSTKTFDLSTNMYSRKYFFDLRYHYTQGHYISNPEAYQTGWNDEMPHPQRPDLRIGSIGLGGGYVLNGNRFSVPAAFTQTKKQLRRAGSLIFGGFVSIYSFEADSSVIPPEAKSLFTDSAQLNHGSALYLGTTIGYAYTFVIRKNFFVTAMALPGFALQSFSGEADDEIIWDDTRPVSFKFNFRLATGWNKDNFYAGLNWSNDNYLLAEKDFVKASFGYYQFRLYIGKRFSF